MHNEIAKDLLLLAGGKNNIISISHCTTRLRFDVKDETKIDIRAIENLQGVQGTFSDTDYSRLFSEQASSTKYIKKSFKCGRPRLLKSLFTRKSQPEAEPCRSFCENTV